MVEGSPAGRSSTRPRNSGEVVRVRGACTMSSPRKRTDSARRWRSPDAGEHHRTASSGSDCTRCLLTQAGRGAGDDEPTPREVEADKDVGGR